MRPVGAVTKVTETELRKNQGANVAERKPSERFEEVLNGSLKLSKHVADRINRRSLDIGTDKMHRLENAVSKAESKGANESLVLLDDLALVVSVKNRTVVTAMNKSNMKEGVFTQIDSAVIG